MRLRFLVNQIDKQLVWQSLVNRADDRWLRISTGLSAVARSTNVQMIGPIVGLPSRLGFRQRMNLQVLWLLHRQSFSGVNGDICCLGKDVKIL